MVGQAFHLPAIPEAELVERALRKDRAAVKIIIKQHNQRLYRIARSIVRNDADAEDILQEAYARAFAQLAMFRGEARLGVWLASIVMNEARGFLRRHRMKAELDFIATASSPQAQVVPFPANPQLDPETSMAQSEIRQLLERAIDNLPETFRTVLVARLVEGMSVAETAELFGILPETVKTRLHRARRLLMAEMEKHIGPVLGDAFPFAGRRCDRIADRMLARLGLV